MIDHALHPPGICARKARPLFDTAVVASADADVRAICRLRGTGCASARGVGLAERLLTDARSPFYADNSAPLREQLRRIRYVLSNEPLPAGITRGAGSRR
jgi:hypothetical protein